MLGYRDGVIRANDDIKNFKLGGIDANQEHIKCPPDSLPDLCRVQRWLFRRSNGSTRVG